MNLLVVDDEALIREVVKEYLSFENINVYEAENGIEAIEIFKKNKIDFIIMDIMMPKMDGYQAVKEIKKIKSNVPVLMLSARVEEYDKLLGFELGIDDYVTKPFSPKELVARVKAISKRQSQDVLLNFDGLCINDEAHEVSIDGVSLELTPKEYELLKYFTQNKNIALSREQLLTHVWGYDFYGDDRTIDTHVKTLRQHLGTYGKYIKTIRKVGYKFEYKEKNT